MSVDLYKYFPTFVKMRDRLASNLSDDDSEEAVLKKLCFMIEEMFDDTDEFIKALLDLGDPDTVDSQYFSHISYLLGIMLPNGGNEQRTRFIIKQLVNHYKTSGTHLAWHTAWSWSDEPDSKIVELFKHEQQEIANYSAQRSANHPLKSARIQLGICASSCESICVNTCESVCESIVEIGEEIPAAEALRRLSFIEYLRPIHVILRQQAENVRLTSGFPNTQETLGHYPAVYGVQPSPWFGSEVYGNIRDEFYTADDDVDIDVQCVSACEVSCQSCCEVVCECNPCEVTCQVGNCELQCTAACQAFCEFACEGACQFACTSCQAGDCTATCAGACLGTCEGACATSCQGSCADLCKATCVSACNADCAAACKASCTAACASGMCQVSSCQSDCASECQASCTTTACQFSNCQAGSCTTDYCMASACQASYCMAASCQISYCMSIVEP